MCGFVGIVGQPDCSADILIGLQALQHRGQDSAGVGTIHQGEFPIVRKLGLVGQSFGPEDGDYPLQISEQDRKWIEKDRRTCYQRELIL